MLIAITKEMHTLAVRPKQHCNRGGEGGEFVPFETKIAWREIENCIEMSQQFYPGLSEMAHSSNCCILAMEVQKIVIFGPVIALLMSFLPKYRKRQLSN